jgi:adenylate kinase family enzyme
MVAAELNTIKLVLFLASDVLDMKDELMNTVIKVNQQAEAEKKAVRLEVSAVCEEGMYPGFYRESPRALIEQIRKEFTPHLIVGVFWNHFGVEEDPDISSVRKQDHGHLSESDWNQEFSQLSDMWAQDDYPKVMLYIYFKPVDLGESEKLLKRYLSYLRGVLTPPGLYWNYFSNKKTDRLGNRVYDYLWRFICSRTSDRFEKPDPDVDLTKSGWEHITSSFLDRQRSYLEAGNRLKDTEAASFFNGESPKWRLIVSESIRPREAVERLGKKIGETAYNNRPRMTLLLGPGGEGKSTILQQIAATLAEKHQDIHVLWRDIESATPAGLELAFIQQLQKTDNYFLLVSDNAEEIAEELWESVLFLQKQPHSKIQFLLASRGTDWRWAEADRKEWRRTLGEGNFFVEQVQPLTETDAKRVIESWEDAGAGGLGEFANIAVTKRVTHLVRLAKEAKSKNPEEGSFLGAMLEARKSQTFDDYVLSILQRIERRGEAVAHRTLLNIFAHIVALHADNQQILSRPVLAHLIPCSEEELESKVITPLADEAATDASSWLVLARHRKIADVAKRILTSNYNINFEHRILPDLFRAAIQLNLPSYKILWGTEARPWYRLPLFYARRKQVDLALRLINITAEAQRDDPFPIVTWANIYRNAGIKLRPKAASIFRERYELISPNKINRGYFAEWAVSEGMIGNHYLSAYLCGIALSDKMTEKYEGDTPIMMLLSEATTAFENLYLKTANRNQPEFFDESNAKTFRLACVAAAELGLSEKAQKHLRADFDKSKSETHLVKGRQLGIDNGLNNVGPSQAINWLLNGLKLAWMLREKDLIKQLDSITSFPSSIIDFNALEFKNLYKLFA